MILCLSLEFVLEQPLSMIGSRVPFIHNHVSFIGFSLAFSSYYDLMNRILITVLWVLRGDILSNNVIGIFIIICSLSLIRIQSLKVVVVAFVLLFFYDIFWVFFSEAIFKQNVMVSVANQNFTSSATKCIFSSFPSIYSNWENSCYTKTRLFLRFPCLIIVLNTYYLGKIHSCLMESKIYELSWIWRYFYTKLIILFSLHLSISSIL